MTLPTYQGAGADNSGAGNVTYTLPSHQVGDLLIGVIETNITVGLAAPTSGSVPWAHVTNSPRAQGSNVTCINVFWVHAMSNSTTNPTVLIGTGDHQVGAFHCIRGAGQPNNFTPVGSGNAALNNMSATGSTTVGSDVMVFVASANQLDSATDNYSTIANGQAGIANLTERNQVFTATGNGGGILFVTFTRASAGATGTTTATVIVQTNAATSNLVFGASAGYLGTATDITNTVSITADGVVGTETTATGITETVTITSDGLVEFGAITATVAETVTVTGTGVVGLYGAPSNLGFSSKVQCTVQAAGVTGVVGAADAIDLSVAVAADGTAGRTSASTLPLSVSILAAGLVTAPGGVPVVETVTIAPTGRVGTASGTTRAETVTIEATGNVLINEISDVANTVVITAAGEVGQNSGTAVTTTVGVTADGQVNAPSAASIDTTVTILAAGDVVTGVSAPPIALTVTIAASGKIHQKAEEDRLFCVGAETRRFTVDAETRRFEA